MDNIASPIITSSGTTTQATETESPSTGTDQTKVPAPPRPPPPVPRLPVSNGDQPSSPVPPIPTRLVPVHLEHERRSNRFSQDIYEDIADSALESYSMSNHDTFSASAEFTRAGAEWYPEKRPLPLNGAPYHSKVEKKDEIGHYKNAALIALSGRTAPPSMSKKIASSLPSLLDPTHYNDSTSPRRRPNEAPGAMRVPGNDDLYDTLAKKKHVPTYTNQTGSSAAVALQMEDDDPDYDEVDDDEEDDSFPDAHHGARFGGKFSAPKATAKGKHASPRKNQNYVVSESYEDMSGMEDLIESLKSSTTVTAL